MATLEELMQRRHDLAEERRKWEEVVTERIASLRRRKINELVDLKAYWEAERKRSGKLDHVTIEKRKNAEMWLEAIVHVLQKPEEIVAQGEVAADGRGTVDVGEEYTRGTNPDNMNVDEAARYLNVSKSTLYKWTSRRKLPHRKVGGKLGFSKGEFDEWMKSKGVMTEAEISRAADEKLAALKSKGRKSR